MVRVVVSQPSSLVKMFWLRKQQQKFLVEVYFLHARSLNRRDVEYISNISLIELSSEVLFLTKEQFYCG